MNPLKIAAIISGRITYNKECFEYLKQLAAHNNITFFVSLNLPHLNKQAKAFVDEFSLGPLQYNLEQPVCPDYVQYFNAAQHEYNSRCSPFIKNIYSHHYHSKRCLELIQAYELKNHLTFDGILKIRPDIQASDCFTISYLDTHTCYIPHEHDYEGGINDQIAYGDRTTMTIYLSLVDCIESMVKAGVLLHPETLLKHHLAAHSIDIKRFPFEYSLDPTRKEQEFQKDWLDPVDS
jgi:hypothetical protein